MSIPPPPVPPPAPVPPPDPFPAPPAGAPTAPGSHRTLLRKAGPWALSAVLVVAAWGLVQLQKPEDAPYDSFVTTTTIGERGVTRNLAITVTAVRAARTVSDGGRWRAQGTWLVVDFDAAAVEDQFAALLATSDLRIGGRIFSATERGDTAKGMTLVTGVPRHGSIAFELPEGALRGPATLVFATEYDTSADGVIEVAIDLDDVAIQNEVELDPIGWAR